MGSVMAIEDDDRYPMITVCQGPPVCAREFGDDDDHAAIMDQCPWCKRIIVAPDGSTTTTEPAKV